MNRQHIGRSLLRAVIGWIVVLLFRLIPNRIPNVEGIMGTLMPVSKKFNYLGSFIYGFGSIILYDLITQTGGLWTLFTAPTYGLIGIWSAFYFKRKQASRGQFVLFSIYGTLFYDIVTGVFGGPLLFGQPFMIALIGQIPFTLYHLAGNITIAALISPIFLKYVVENPRFEFSGALAPSKS